MSLDSFEVIDTAQRFGPATVEYLYIEMVKLPLNQQHSSTPLLLSPCSPRQ